MGVLSMKKFIIFICITAMLLVSLIVPVSAQNYASSIDRLNCKVDLLISLDSGEVLINKNADARVAPASLTKIMTALVVLEKCKNLEQAITVKQSELDTLLGTGSSTSGLKDGEVMSLYNMLCCLLIPSGNDAAVVLACEVGGSVDGFVKMMNDEAKKLGCKNTHFVNPHGLDNDNHYTTANDLAKMAKAALKYSAFEAIVSNSTYDMPATNKNDKRVLINTNFLLNSAYPTYYYRYCKGIKTGSTDNAGKCLISYAAKDGYQYLAVAMGGDYRDSDEDGVEENQSFMDSLRMYRWAFDNLSYEMIAKKNQFATTVSLNYCWAMDSIRLVARDDKYALIPSGNDSDSVSFEPIELGESLDAPLKAGDEVCDAKIMFAGQQIGTVKLVVAEDANLSVILYAKAALKKMTGYTIFKIVIILIVLFIGLYVFLLIRSNAKRRKKRELKIVKYNELQRNTQKKKK